MRFDSCARCRRGPGRKSLTARRRLMVSRGAMFEIGDDASASFDLLLGGDGTSQGSQTLERHERDYIVAMLEKLHWQVEGDGGVAGDPRHRRRRACEGACANTGFAVQAAAHFRLLRETRAELLGLQWGDIDWRGSFMHVQRNIVRGQLTTPKNHPDRRAHHVRQRAARTSRRVNYAACLRALAAGHGATSRRRSTGHTPVIQRIDGLRRAA